MDKIKITGGVPLKGKVEIGGAKNAALPLMALSILTEEDLVLSNIPHLSDITTMANLLNHLGIAITIDGSVNKGNFGGRTIIFNSSNITSTTAPYEIVRKMRASFIVLGPLLARFNKAKISLPGGCAIGTRPIDFHLQAFEKMGVEITLEDGYVLAEAKYGLKGADITLPKPSVGATENILMAATLADGKTVINNAACEPEVSDLANCLNKMGADISGIDTNILTINGVKKLSGTEHKVIADRIEAGTYAIAALITDGELELTGITTDIMQSTIEKIRDAGADVVENNHGFVVKRSNRIKSVDIVTDVYPGFATDMQAQMMALMCIADNESEINENIFENRFMHVPELNRMGAEIAVDGNTAFVTGVKKLRGAEVMATDLRASVALVLAALVAEGETTINRVYHIDRGYEKIEEKLALCGARIKRVA